jgi:hypothetical protein
MSTLEALHFLYGSSFSYFIGDSLPGDDNALLILDKETKKGDKVPISEQIFLGLLLVPWHSCPRPKWISHTYPGFLDMARRY